MRAGRDVHSSELPYIDEHAGMVEAEPEETWRALVEVVERSFAGPLAAAIARILACEDHRRSGPRPLAAGSRLPGFHVSSALADHELALVGSHRFSRYALIFRLQPMGAGRCRVSAETRAEFPGAVGRLYRALVIGTRGHVAVVRLMLAAVRRTARQQPRL
jgi:hypothetical protein